MRPPVQVAQPASRSSTSRPRASGSPAACSARPASVQATDQLYRAREVLTCGSLLEAARGGQGRSAPAVKTSYARYYLERGADRRSRGGGFSGAAGSQRPKADPRERGRETGFQIG